MSGHLSVGHHALAVLIEQLPRRLKAMQSAIYASDWPALARHVEWLKQLSFHAEFDCFRESIGELERASDRFDAILAGDRLSDIASQAAGLESPVPVL